MCVCPQNSVTVLLQQTVHALIVFHCIGSNNIMSDDRYDESMQVVVIST